MFEQTILHWYLLAYLSHPKFRDEKLNYKQNEKARAWIQKINPSFISYAINLEVKETFF